MKVFRKVTPGVNPDIEVHEVLTRAGSEHVAALYGWLERRRSTAADEPVQLAMLQQFLRTASDGWDLALASVRDLFAEADLHADEVGGDFAGEADAARRGAARGARRPRRALPHRDVRTADELAALADAMPARLDAALDVVPELAEYADGPARDASTRVAELCPAVRRSQQIHGDLHLGQTLRTVKGWKIVDFEGEPAKPLAERVAARLAVARRRRHAAVLRLRRRAWSSATSQRRRGRRRAARLPGGRVGRAQPRRFLRGYAGGRTSASSPTQQDAARAYVADKAVYEAVYEARNRPTWLPIPLGRDRAARAADDAT